jgi:hypothetical protein
MTDHGRKVEHAMEIAGGMVGELAEAHTEIERLRAEVEALSASLREKDDRTPSGKRSADYWLRMLQAAEARLEAVEALCEAAEQSSRAEADPPDQHALPVSLLTTREVRAALSVAPQPEPARCPHGRTEAHDLACHYPGPRRQCEHYCPGPKGSCTEAKQ